MTGFFSPEGVGGAGGGAVLRGGIPFEELGLGVGRALLALCLFVVLEEVLRVTSLCWKDSGRLKYSRYKPTMVTVKRSKKRARARGVFAAHALKATSVAAVTERRRRPKRMMIREATEAWSVMVISILGMMRSSLPPFPPS